MPDPASASAVVSSIALRRAEDKVRHPATRIQVELDRPGGRIETGLALRNQRKIFHVQLSLQHAYDLIRAEKVPGGTSRKASAASAGAGDSKNRT